MARLMRAEYACFLAFHWIGGLFNASDVKLTRPMRAEHDEFYSAYMTETMQKDLAPLN